ncbi:MAG: two component transcriptional regulator, LuxR family [Chloroflexi bacterium]|jgi:DNA-binding NarL/FixJ family response regulator|nr:two component transcriptional regulator, LuxR family [Chloroflexota bacterium]
MRVVLAEDSDVVRRGIRKLLNKAADVDVVGEAKNGFEALQLVKELSPDILLLDVEMPFLNGIEVARRLRKDGNKVQILVLSAYDDKEYIRQMLINGAAGYLIKDESPEQIIESMRRLIPADQ